MKNIIFCRFSGLVIVLALGMAITGCVARNTQSSAFTVVATGVGKDCEQALRSAKDIAISQPYGQLVDSKKSLIGDKIYAEKYEEYSAGTIKEYKILSTNYSNGYCDVKIESLIEPAHYSIESNKNSATVSTDIIVERANRDSENNNKIDKLIKRPQLMKVGFDNLKAKDMGSEYQLDYVIKSIDISKSWYSDLERFLKVSSLPVVCQKDSSEQLIPKLANAFTLGIFGIGNDTLAREGGLEILCFGSEPSASMSCYSGKAVEQTRAKLQFLSLRQVIKNEDAVVVSDLTLKPAGLALISRRSYGDRYLCDGKATHGFDIVGPAGLPASVRTRVPKSALEKNGELLLVPHFGQAGY